MNSSISPISSLRQSAGMTRQQFAQYFGLSLRAVQSWELGDRNAPAYLVELMRYKLSKEGLI